MVPVPSMGGSARLRRQRGGGYPRHPPASPGRIFNLFLRRKPTIYRQETPAIFPRSQGVSRIPPPPKGGGSDRFGRQRAGGVCRIPPFPELVMHARCTHFSGRSKAGLRRRRPVTVLPRNDRGWSLWTKGGEGSRADLPPSQAGGLDFFCSKRAGGYPAYPPLGVTRSPGIPRCPNPGTFRNRSDSGSFHRWRFHDCITII